MVLGPGGNAWITMRSNAIGKVTAAGAVTKYAMPTANGYPFDIAAASMGTLVHKFRRQQDRTDHAARGRDGVSRADA